LNHQSKQLIVNNGRVSSLYSLQLTQHAFDH
jgi:hypothetical protein